MLPKARIDRVILLVGPWSRVARETSSYVVNAPSRLRSILDRIARGFSQIGTADLKAG